MNINLYYWDILFWYKCQLKAVFTIIQKVNKLLEDVKNNYQTNKVITETYFLNANKKANPEALILFELLSQQSDQGIDSNTMHAIQALSQQYKHISNDKIGHDYGIYDKRIELCEEIIKKVDPVLLKSETDYSKHLNLLSLYRDKYILVKMHEMFNFQTFVSNYAQQWIGASRKFGDIVKGGATTAAEAKVIEAAAHSLKPHEFNKAVRDNISLPSLESMMKTSLVESLNQKLTLEHHVGRVDDAILAKKEKTYKLNSHVDNITNNTDKEKGLGR